MDRWHTKEDVIKDLALANGLGTNFVDDSFIISGARPPPPPRHLKEEDDELELRYGKFGSHYYESLKPDLKGISEMVRMVNQPQKKDYRQKPEETQIEICKLNPHVPEFVPRRNMYSTNNSSSGVTAKVQIENAIKNSGEKEESVTKEAENSNEAKREHFLEPTQNGLPTTNRNSCDQNDDEIQQEKNKLEAMLKEKIIETAKAKTVKGKTARNVAIAALLKLKAGPSQPPLLLRPPNFYDNKTLDTQADVTSLPESTHEIDYQKQSEEGTKPNLEPVEVAKADINPEEQESIKKVMNWLNQPEKPKALEPLHTGPINFKKRDTVPLTGEIVYKKKETKEASNSPVSDTASQKPSHSQPGAFVPSKYASDLAKKYEERTKAKEDRQLDIWSKLERDLKARDEVLKERMKAQSETSPNASRGSSRCSSKRQNHQ